MAVVTRRRTLTGAAVLLLVCGVLAGCVGPTAPAGPGDDEEDVLALPTPRDMPSRDSAPDLPFTLQDCAQLHAVFPTPAEGWHLPPGFTPAPFDPAGATTAVLWAAARCASGTLGNATFGPFGEAWLLLAVVPPEEHRDSAFVSEFLFLSAVIDGDAVFDHLTRLGLQDLRAGRVVHLSQSAPGGSTGLWTVVGGEATFQVPYATTAASGPFGPGPARYWLADLQDGAWGYLAVNASQAPDGGTGSALFSAQDDPEAPPLYPGIAHRVDGVDVALTRVLLDEQA